MSTWNTWRLLTSSTMAGTIWDTRDESNAFKFVASIIFQDIADLQGCGAGPNDGNPLAAVVVAVVPTGRVERCAFEPRRTGEFGDLEGITKLRHTEGISR